MADYGFKLSVPSKNVLYAQSPQDFIFHSKYNTLKIWKIIKGGFAVPINSTASFIFTHGLGYYPAHLTFYKLKQSAVSWWCDEVSLNTNIADNDNMRASTFVNSSTIKYQVVSPAVTGVAGTIAYTSFIFLDPMGYIPTGTTGAPLVNNVGIKVSQPGISVLSAKAHEMAINSSYPNLKFHMDKTVSFTVLAANTSGEISFAHGLNYVPAFSAMIIDPNDSTIHRVVPFGLVPGPSATGVRADINNIYCSAVKIVTDGDLTYTFRVIVFKDKISEA